jgi:hypothetical protein
MRRKSPSASTVTAKLAEAEVPAGRAASVSAWRADAIRAKARARAELLADLEELESNEPTPAEPIARVARSLGLSRTAVSRALKTRTKARSRRAA